MILAINKRTENLAVEGSSMSARRVTRRLRSLYRDVIVEVEGTADASTVAGGDFPPSSKRIKDDRINHESRVIEARRRLDRYASRCYRASR